MRSPGLGFALFGRLRPSGRALQETLQEPADELGRWKPNALIDALQFPWDKH